MRFLANLRDSTNILQSGLLRLKFDDLKSTRGILKMGYLPVLLAATRGQRSKARHEKVQPGEGHHVDGQFSEVSVELTGEPEAGGDSRHSKRDQMVQVTIGGGGQF